MQISLRTALAAASLALVPLTARAQVVTYTDRAAFNTAVTPNVFEDFTSTSHFPITSGVLNSFTNEPAATNGGIHPGDIQPGVTYSYPVNNPGENQFNIDIAPSFDGGFLDSGLFTDNPASTLTLTFDSPTTGFGFDTNAYMGRSFDVTFHLADGSTTMETLPVDFTYELQFFGFQDTGGIRSATITGDGSGENFALDNFAFNSGAPVPEASTTASFGLLLALGLGGVLVAAKRRKAGSAA